MQKDENLNVIIVDDEEIVISDMLSLINWEASGFNVVGTAYNARQTVSLIQSRHVDIVFMDIALPGQNGLDLSAELKKNNPDLEIIILTSYMEFAYARKAMESGISKYIVKHEMTPELLLQTLSNARDKIYSKKLQSIMIQQHILRDIIERNVNPANFAPTLEIQGLQEYMIALFFNVDPLFRDVSKDYENNKNTVSVSEIKNIRTKNYVPQYLLFMNWGLLCFFKVTETNYAEFISLLDNISNYMGNQIEETVKSIYHENLQYGLSHLNEATQVLRKSIPYAGFYSKYKHISAQDIQSNIHQKKDQEPIKWNLEDLDITDREAVEKVNPVLINLIKSYDLTGMQSLCSTVNNAINRIDGTILKDHGIDRILYYSQLPDFYRSVLTDLESRNSSRQQYSPMTRAAIKYIEENYQNNISLTELASQMHGSSMYIGQIFIRDTEISFHKYLSQYRIDKAKLLLQNTNEKILEISAEVGISNSQYFSKLFKELTGMSPNDYRDKNT